MKPLAEPAIAAVRDGRIRIVPERFEKVYLNWMENIRDWCISRQLWWGHRIPVWYCDACGERDRRDRGRRRRCPDCGGASCEQDPDVLDTWFSSGLWPFSARSAGRTRPRTCAYFYPTQRDGDGLRHPLLLGGADDHARPRTTWASVPFHTVYLHGLVRDETAQKMSKTQGNVIDPLMMIDEYGTDALRFALVTGGTPGNDMRSRREQARGRRATSATSSGTRRAS